MAALLGHGECVSADPWARKREIFASLWAQGPAVLQSCGPLLWWPMHFFATQTELRLSFLETAGDLPWEMPFFDLDFAMIP